MANVYKGALDLLAQFSGSDEAAALIVCRCHIALGDTQARVTGDMVNLSNGIESTLPSLLGQGILMAAIAVMMLFTNVWLALIYIIAMPLTFIGLRVIAARTKKEFIKTNRQLGKMNSLVSDTYSNHTVVKAYSRVDEKEAEFDGLNKEFESMFVRSRFTSGFMRPFSDLMSKISYILLCLIGGFMMLGGTLTLGEFTAFLFFGNMIGVPISELSVAFNNFQDSLSSADARENAHGGCVLYGEARQYHGDRRTVRRGQNDADQPADAVL